MCLPLPRTATINTMQNKKLVRIIIWVVVIGMVLGLLVSAITIFV